MMQTIAVQLSASLTPLQKSTGKGRIKTKNAYDGAVGRKMRYRTTVMSLNRNDNTKGYYGEWSLLVAGLSAAMLLSGPTLPSYAGLETSTFKAGESALVEQSDITAESAKETVDKLKQVVQDAQDKLSQDTGKNDPYVKEIETVKSEIASLEDEIAKGGRESNIKSLASSIEAQLNGLKAILGFD